MRVLWLCSTPALGAELLGVPATHGGGWVAALEAAIKERPGIDLSIGFPWNESRVRQIEAGRHRYLPYPRYPRGSRLRRLLVDASCRLEPASEIEHLERVVELSRPDLIHVWGTEAFFGLLAERCSLPVLVEIQGVRTACAEAYCSGLTRLDLLRYGSPKRLLNGRSLLHTYYRYRRSAVRERRILGRARFVSGRTEWDRLRCAALAPCARYFHCDRVLRPSFYRARWRRGIRNGPLRVVSTLRGNAYKGIETVAGAAALLERTLGRGLEWSLIGIRPGEEVHHVVERKLGVSFERLGIKLVGRQPVEQVVRRLLDGDLFAMPSRIENSPNGLCEAMMVGMPVVSSDVGGVPSLLEHGREGLLVPAGDPSALAGALRRLAEDHQLAERLAAAARRRARKRHDRSTVAATLEGIYREVLASGPTPAAPSPSR